MKKYKKILTILFIIGCLIFIGIFVFTGKAIGDSVFRQCENAKQLYGGDCTSSLIIFLEDEQNSYEDRNGAIWALGQLGDNKALYLLENYYTGYNPDKKCNRFSELCQYEIYKAILLLKGGMNISAFMWR